MRVNTGTRGVYGLLLVLSFYLALPARAQEVRTIFLFLDPGAAAAGMGETGVAFRTGAWAVHSNPAGLAFGAENDASASYRTWLGGQNMVNASARIQAGTFSGFGVFAGGLLDGSSNAEPGRQNITSGVAAAHRFGPMAFGLALRYVSERFDPYHTYGLGFDAGARIASKGDLVQAGASISRLSLFVQESEGLRDPLPPTLRLGAAARPVRLVDIDGRPIAVPVFAVDYVVPDLEGNGNREGQWHLGLGVEVFETAVVRAGYITHDAARDWTIGLGFRQGTVAFDYALQPFTEAYAGNIGHIFSLTYGW